MNLAKQIPNADMYTTTAFKSCGHLKISQLNKLKNKETKF
jgi:hypothetical protein